MRTKAELLRAKAVIESRLVLSFAAQSSCISRSSFDRLKRASRDVQFYVLLREAVTRDLQALEAGLLFAKYKNKRSKNQLEA